jgi:hypothetical protein
MSASVIRTLFTIRDNIKIAHWQTKSFSRHSAAGSLVDKLDDLIDTFVETYMGKYGRPVFMSNNMVPLMNVTDKNADNIVKIGIEYLEKLPESLGTDLLNIRDEMLGEMHKIQYLFTLK